MISITIEVPSGVDLEERLDAARDLARKHGTCVEGDTEVGSFFGGAYAGSWVRLQDRLTINVSRTAIPVPKPILQKAVLKFLKQS